MYNRGTDHPTHTCSRVMNETEQNMIYYDLDMYILLRKPAFCICKNKGADQHICFSNADSTSPLFLKSLTIFCGCTARFVSDMVGNPENRFIRDEVHILAHLSRRLIGELIGYSWSGVRPSVRRPSVHNAQRSSSPKPLGQSKPNFMWSLLG